MTSFRLFLALELSSEVKTLLEEQQLYLKHMLEPDWFRFSDSSSLHLTLLFLGLVFEDKVSGITQAISFACRRVPTFSLATGQMGAFPSLQRPSVIWTGVEGDLEALKTLQIRLRQQLSGFAANEDHTYQPHLTLARVKQFGKNESISNALLAAPSFKPENWEINRVQLVRSLLKPEGSQYQVLHSEPLLAD
jgi:2'-5' RNA ligase